MPWYEKYSEDQIIKKTMDEFAPKTPPFCPLYLGRVAVYAIVQKGILRITCPGEEVSICKICRIRNKTIYIDPDNNKYELSRLGAPNFTETNSRFDPIAFFLTPPEQRKKDTDRKYRDLADY